MRLPLLFLSVALVPCLGFRPKTKDSVGQPLIPLDDIGTSCGSDAYMGYAIVEDSLEKCDNFSAVKLAAGDATAYEEFKCTNLRVHGEFRSGKCVCKKGWKGATCNVYDGCPEGQSLHNSVCTANPCQHDGKMAIGTKGMECICQNEWDGKFCDRLACWRLTERGQEKRYRIDKETKTCVCGEHYAGDTCDEVTSCEKNGQFQDGSCICNEGYGGRICDKKCRPGEITCAANSLLSLFVLAVSFLLLNR